MRFDADHGVLSAALQTVTRALPSHAANPLAAGVLLTAADDGGDAAVTVSSFDYEVATEVRVPARGVEPGRVLAYGRRVAEVVRMLRCETVRVETDAAELAIAGGSAAFGLAVLPVDDHPKPPARPTSLGTVSGPALAVAVEQTVLAAGTDDALPVLTAVLVKANADGLTLVATDRYRLVETRVPWLTPAADALPADGLAVMISAPTMRHVAATFGASTAVTVGFTGSESGSGGWFGCWDESARYIGSRPLEGTPVRYERLWPGEPESVLRVPVARFVEACRRVRVVSERQVPLALHCDGDGVRIETRGGDGEHAAEQVPASYRGEPLSVGFYADYLLDALRVIPTGYAHLAFVGAAKPVVITEAPAPVPDGDGTDAPAAANVVGSAVSGYRHLVTPRRLPET
jgi:DNA polymerase-3 subunit beta